MKKIISFILALMMISQNAFICSAESVSRADTALEIMTQLGYVTYTSSDEIVTRGDFAVILYEMLSENTQEDGIDWESSFFGDSEEETKLISDDGDKKEISIFVDVTTESEYYDCIMYGVGRGIFEGVGRGQFKPADDVTIVHLLKSLLSLMGYKEYAELAGGYPNGYMNVADSLGMTKGIVKSANESATISEVALILYNTFDVNCFEIEKLSSNGVTFTQDNTKTFLDKYLHMSYVKDMIYDNGIYSLDGVSDIPKNSVKIGNYIFNATDEQLASIREDMGKSVIAYYSIDEDTENDLMCYAVSEDSTIVITEDEFEAYTDGTLTYTKDNKTVNTRIIDGAVMIYNGEYKSSYTDDVFNIQRGNIKILKTTKNGSYDCVIIENYQTWYVNTIEYDNYKIYNGIMDKDTSTDDDILDLSQIMEEGTSDLMYSDGTSLKFEDITINGIIDFYCAGDKYIKLYYSTEAVENVVISGLATDDDGNRIIKTRDAEYTVSPEFAGSINNIPFVLNDRITIILNSFGEIAWAIDLAEEYYDLPVNYMFGFVRCEEDELYQLKLINDKGVEQKYELAEKVTLVNNITLTREGGLRYSPERIYEELQTYKGVIAYKMNNKKQITLIEIPYYTRAGEGRLQVMYDCTGLAESAWPRSQKSAFCYLSNKAWMDSKTIMWIVPTVEENKTKAENYSMTTISTFPSDGTIRGAVICYGINPETVYSRWVDYRYDMGSKITNDEENFVIVTDVRNEVMADDTPAVVIDGKLIYSNVDMQDVTLYSLDGAGTNKKAPSSNPAEAATSFFHSNDGEAKNYYKVKKGDIIRYSYKENKNYPTMISILYRAEDKNILETIGEYNSNYSEDKTNPFVLSYYNERTSVDPQGTGEGTRYALGYLYDVQDNIGIITTQNLRNESYDSSYGVNGSYRRYTKIFAPVKQNRGYVIDYTEKEIKITQYPYSSGYTDGVLKTYTQYGRNCSKILTVGGTVMTNLTFVILDEE